MKTCFFSIATDPKNMEYYEMMKNSLKKFHPDIPLFLWDAEKAKKYDDEMFHYRSTPVIMKELMNDYELIIQTNADQIITGNLDHVLRGDYDVGVVYNANRVDPKQYGVVSCWDIPYTYYYNLGFVAVRSKRFIEHWNKLVFSYHFGNYQYKEQDLLNIMLYYGDYRIKCFDEYDPKTKESYWNGLISKGEWHRAIMRGDKMVIPKSEDGYPERDKELKVLHWAGGNNGVKMNYKTYFNQDCITYLDWLTTNTKLSFSEYVSKRFENKSRTKVQDKKD